jgi:hypothetical protein
VARREIAFEACGSVMSVRRGWGMCGDAEVGDECRRPIERSRIVGIAGEVCITRL